ncbi:MAG TPA: heat-shock protein, partial [Aquabacterium sp.]|nr:heat-shock protein [Aquabacterium sp.]
LYFTGGSTGFKPLADRIAGRFPRAAAVRGDKFASVAQGLGLHARRLDGRAATG